MGRIHQLVLFLIECFKVQIKNSIITLQKPHFSTVYFLAKEEDCGIFILSQFLFLLVAIFGIRVPFVLVTTLCLTF